MASETVVFNHFPDIAKKLPEVLGQLIETALTHMEAGAKQDAPVLTGYLRDHITHRMTGPTSGELLAEADYSGYPEFGTVHQAAHPYFLVNVERERVDLEHAFRGLESHLR